MESKTNFAYAYVEYDRFETGFDTRERAIAAACENEPDAPIIWTGILRTAPASTYFKIDVLEHMGEIAGEELGDCAESWLQNVTPEQRKELDAAILAAIDTWATKHAHHPAFGEIENVERYERIDAAEKE